MLGLNENMRYYVCQRYVRMDMDINGLCKLVSQKMGMSPLSGSVFIFFCKHRPQIKILHCDGDGFALYQKRLEKGSYSCKIFKYRLRDAFQSQ